MAMFPGAQHRAQHELDAVLQPGQVPNFGDREMLPYMDCIIQEVLRYVNHVTKPDGPFHEADFL